MPARGIVELVLDGETSFYQLVCPDSKSIYLLASIRNILHMIDAQDYQHFRVTFLTGMYIEGTTCIIEHEGCDRKIAYQIEYTGPEGKIHGTWLPHWGGDYL